MIQPDKEGVQYFLVEPHDEVWLQLFEATNPPSLSMLYEATLNLQVPLELGNYLQFRRIRYTFKHQRTKVVFIVFPHFDPQKSDNVIMYYPYLLDRASTEIEKRQG